MRTFVIRARKGTVRRERLRERVGEQGHMEVVAHCVMNAFFYAGGFREDTEVFLVLDGARDFPRTVRLVAGDGLSMDGFHEEAVWRVLEQALRSGENMSRDEVLQAAPGVYILGFGFERVLSRYCAERPVFMMSPKGADIRETMLPDNPVFVLSDHLPMPKNSIRGMIRNGAQLLSLGRKMLFASQCVILLHHEMDRS